MLIYISTASKHVNEEELFRVVKCLPERRRDDGQDLCSVGQTSRKKQEIGDGLQNSCIIEENRLR